MKGPGKDKEPKVPINNRLHISMNNYYHYGNNRFFIFIAKKKTVFVYIKSKYIIQKF